MHCELIVGFGGEAKFISVVCAGVYVVLTIRATVL